MVKSAENINCSEPTTDGLITALKENIFGKTEIRPVINLKTPTNISVNFILYGILDVVSSNKSNNSQSWPHKISIHYIRNCSQPILHSIYIYKGNSDWNYIL